MSRSTQAVSSALDRRPSSSKGSRMFPLTSSVGTRLKAWKTNPTRRRRRIVRSASARLVISVEPSQARPLVAMSRPAMMCMSVDLPDPLGPMMAVNCPCRRPMLTSSRAVTVFGPLP